jgi:hypothetical protein
VRPNFARAGDQTGATPPGKYLECDRRPECERWRFTGGSRTAHIRCPPGKGRPAASLDSALRQDRYDARGDSKNARPGSSTPPASRPGSQRLREPSGTLQIDRIHTLEELDAHERFGDIPIAWDEPSALTSGALLVGLAEATLHRQPISLGRSCPGPASGEISSDGVRDAPVFPD